MSDLKNLNDLNSYLASGVAHHIAGRWQQARAVYETVLQNTPAHADALHLLGLLVQKQGDLHSAERLIKQAIASNPQQAQFWSNLSLVYQAQGRFDQALQSAQQALQIDPTYAKAHNNLGIFYKERAQLQQAEQHFLRAVELDATQPQMLSNLGMAQKDLGKLDEAERNLRRALALQPQFAEAYNHLGLILKEADRLPEAQQAFKQALALKPQYADAYNNLGSLFCHIGAMEQAQQALQQALALRPDYAPAHQNLGFVDLLCGRFASGWREYDYRIQVQQASLLDCRKLPYPPWQGQSLQGRRLLLVREQGLGDQIQFIRYAHLLQQQGAQVDVVASPELHTLLRSAPGVTQIFAALPDAQQTYDYWSYLLSVPRWLATDLSNIPAPIPYLNVLSVAPQRVAYWRQRLHNVANGRRKIGIVWAGNPHHKNDRFRSLRLALLQSCFTSDAIWFSLQKGGDAALPTIEEVEKTAVEKSKQQNAPLLVGLGTELHDFVETAAVLENLDLLITVDTSVAHLAGALGRPTWVLLPANPDWRWLLERNDSPWYPSMYLFRQEKLGDWGPVLVQLKQALQKISEKIIDAPSELKAD